MPINPLQKIFLGITRGELDWPNLLKVGKEGFSALEAAFFIDAHKSNNPFVKGTCPVTFTPPFALWECLAHALSDRGDDIAPVITDLLGSGGEAEWFRAFFTVPEDRDIYKMPFMFLRAAGLKEQRTADGLRRLTRLMLANKGANFDIDYAGNSLEITNPYHVPTVNASGSGFTLFAFTRKSVQKSEDDVLANSIEKATKFSSHGFANMISKGLKGMVSSNAKEKLADNSIMTQIYASLAKSILESTSGASKTDVATLLGLTLSFIGRAGAIVKTGSLGPVKGGDSISWFFRQHACPTYSPLNLQLLVMGHHVFASHHASGHSLSEIASLDMDVISKILKVAEGDYLLQHLVRNVLGRIVVWDSNPAKVAELIKEASCSTDLNLSHEWISLACSSIYSLSQKSENNPSIWANKDDRKTSLISILDVVCNQAKDTNDIEGLLLALASADNSEGRCLEVIADTLSVYDPNIIIKVASRTLVNQSNANFLQIFLYSVFKKAPIEQLHQAFSNVVCNVVIDSDLTRRFFVPLLRVSSQGVNESLSQNDRFEELLSVALSYCPDKDCSRFFHSIISVCQSEFPDNSRLVASIALPMLEYLLKSYLGSSIKTDKENFAQNFVSAIAACPSMHWEEVALQLAHKRFDLLSKLLRSQENLLAIYSAKLQLSPQSNNSLAYLINALGRSSDSTQSGHAEALATFGLLFFLDPKNSSFDFMVAVQAVPELLEAFHMCDKKRLAIMLNARYDIKLDGATYGMKVIELFLLYASLIEINQQSPASCYTRTVLHALETIGDALSEHRHDQDQKRVATDIVCAVANIVKNNTYARYRGPICDAIALWIKGLNPNVLATAIDPSALSTADRHAMFGACKERPTNLAYALFLMSDFSVSESVVGVVAHSDKSYLGTLLEASTIVLMDGAHAKAASAQCFDSWHKLWRYLINDADLDVRTALAAGFASALVRFGKEDVARQFIGSVFLADSQDDSMQVDLNNWYKTVFEFDTVTKSTDLMFLLVACVDGKADRLMIGGVEYYHYLSRQLGSLNALEPVIELLFHARCKESIKGLLFALNDSHNVSAPITLDQERLRLGYFSALNSAQVPAPFSCNRLQLTGNAGAGKDSGNYDCFFDSPDPNMAAALKLLYPGVGLDILCKEAVRFFHERKWDVSDGFLLCFIIDTTQIFVDSYDLNDLLSAIIKEIILEHGACYDGEKQSFDRFKQYLQLTITKLKDTFPAYAANEDATLSSLLEWASDFSQTTLTQVQCFEIYDLLACFSNAQAGAILSHAVLGALEQLPSDLTEQERVSISFHTRAVIMAAGPCPAVSIVINALKCCSLIIKDMPAANQECASLTDLAHNAWSMFCKKADLAYDANRLLASSFVDFFSSYSADIGYDRFLLDLNSASNAALVKAVADLYIKGPKNNLISMLNRALAFSDKPETGLKIFAEALIQQAVNHPYALSDLLLTHQSNADKLFGKQLTIFIKKHAQDALVEIVHNSGIPQCVKHAFSMLDKDRMGQISRILTQESGINDLCLVHLSHTPELWMWACAVAVEKSPDKRAAHFANLYTMLKHAAPSQDDAVNSKIKGQIISSLSSYVSSRSQDTLILDKDITSDACIKLIDFFAANETEPADPRALNALLVALSEWSIVFAQYTGSDEKINDLVRALNALSEKFKTLSENIALEAVDFSLMVQVHDSSELSLAMLNFNVRLLLASVDEKKAGHARNCARFMDKLAGGEEQNAVEDILCSLSTLYPIIDNIARLPLEPLEPLFTEYFSIVSKITDQEMELSDALRLVKDSTTILKGGFPYRELDTLAKLIDKSPESEREPLYAELISSAASKAIETIARNDKSEIKERLPYFKDVLLALCSLNLEEKLATHGADWFRATIAIFKSAAANSADAELDFFVEQIKCIASRVKLHASGCNAFGLICFMRAQIVEGPDFCTAIGSNLYKSMEHKDLWAVVQNMPELKKRLSELSDATDWDEGQAMINALSAIAARTSLMSIGDIINSNPKAGTCMNNKFMERIVSCCIANGADKIVSRIALGSMDHLMAICGSLSLLDSGGSFARAIGSQLGEMLNYSDKDELAGFCTAIFKVLVHGIINQGADHGRCNADKLLQGILAGLESAQSSHSNIINFCGALSSKLSDNLLGSSCGGAEAGLSVQPWLTQPISSLIAILQAKDSQLLAQDPNSYLRGASSDSTTPDVIALSGQ